MSVYDFYQRKMKVNSNSTGKNYPTLGEKLKHDSDMLIEQLWEGDVQSKVCYIYDYFHDDQPDKNVGMTYENTTKTKIDAKFIVKTYQSIDKDQVEYYIQFRPSQKTHFEEGDELYYFETDYRLKYGNESFVGLFCDIPDDEGTYRKWLICEREHANQFVKYLVLPCDYHLHWIERNGQECIKRAMWCVQRQQSSYTIGTYRERYFEHPDNQTKLWFELNSITEKFWYNDDRNKTMRLIVSAPTENPLVWRITKCENFKPLGIQKLTLYQDYFNEQTDYIERDDTGRIVAMYADYCDSNIEPTDPDTPSPTPSNTYGKITASTSTIKVGGSYKTLTLKLYDSSGEEVTDSYSSYSTDDFKWTCSITDGNKTTDLSDVVSWIKGSSFNKKKIKFPNDRSYLGKILDVKCIIDGIEVVEEFELII